MKKTFRKALAAALAVATVSTCVSGISANAAVWYATAEPEGYTILEETGLYRLRIVGKNYPYEKPYTVYYQKPDQVGDATFVSLLCDYGFNFTRLYITNVAAFQNIYYDEKYEDLLDFDVMNTQLISETSSKYGEKNVITFFDEKDENGAYSKNIQDYTNKQDILIQFCKELKDANAIAAAYYTPMRAFEMKGYYEDGAYIYDAPRNELENIQKIAEKYDNTVEVTEIGSETSLISDYNITGVEDIVNAAAIAQEIQSVYDGASGTVSGAFMEDASQSISSAETDLTTAQITGDITGDFEVDTFDAYEALLYCAKEGAGYDAAFTDGDEVKETAAYASADVNGDGKIDTNDAYLILKYYAEKSAGYTPSWELK